MLQRTIHADGGRRRSAGRALVALAAVLLLAGAAGGLVPALDLIALARPLLLGLGGLGWLLLTGSGWRRQALAGLGLLTAAWPGRPLAAAGAAACPRPLIVLQWNMRFDNPRREAAVAWLAGQDADVLLLAEAPYDMAARLSGRWPAGVTCHALAPCSTLVLARPLGPAIARPLARGDAENRQALSAARLDLGAATLVSVHLSRPLPLGRQGRETSELIADLGDAEPARMIVGGDFNATPAMAPVRRLAAAFGLARVGAPGASWPNQPLPLITIDNLLVGRGWRVMAADRLVGPGSDHLAERVALCPAPLAGPPPER